MHRRGTARSSPPTGPARPPAVAMPISVIVTRKVYLRPSLSPRKPNSTAPSGRKPKPTANPAQASSVCSSLVARREEGAADDRRGERAVDEEIVPFEHRAERRRGDDEPDVLRRRSAVPRLPVDHDRVAMSRIPLADAGLAAAAVRQASLPAQHPDDRREIEPALPCVGEAARTARGAPRPSACRRRRCRAASIASRRSLSISAAAKPP